MNREPPAGVIFFAGYILLIMVITCLPHDSIQGTNGLLCVVIIFLAAIFFQLRQH